MKKKKVYDFSDERLLRALKKARETFKSIDKSECEKIVRNIIAQLETNADFKNAFVAVLKNRYHDEEKNMGYGRFALLYFGQA